MSSVASQIVERLEGFPQHVPDLAIPVDLAPDELDSIYASIDSLAKATPTATARNCVLQAAAQLPPSKTLEDEALLWAQDQGPSVDSVVQHINLALEKRIFEPRRWVRATADVDTPRALAILLAWAPADFDAFLTLCKDEFQDPALRTAILEHVIEILLGSPYSPESSVQSTLMYQLASHSFFQSIIYSALFDTRNKLFAVTLTTIGTVLPFALHLWTRHVPLLMVVLGRAISWRDRPFINHQQTEHSGVTKTPLPNPSIDWTIAEEEDNPPAPTPTEQNVVSFFLVNLYGAWPSNLVAFVRAVDSYLETKQVEPVYNVPWKDVWEPGVVGSRLLPLISGFQLHPSIISYTSAGELQNDNRWEKYDPSEFVSTARLMSRTSDDLDTNFSFFKNVSELEPPPKPVLTVPEPLAGDDKERLKEENQLLRLESMYNARLLKQYVYHIERLHRNSLRFQSDEAEIHTFVNRIKEQSKTIATLNKELSQQRSDASASQQKHVKWQEQLRDKVSNFRDKQRTWQTESTNIKGELTEAQQSLKRVADELAREKNERFILENQLKEATPKIVNIADYETRIQQLMDAQLLWDADVDKLRDAEENVTQFQSRCVELETMLRAREKICREQAEALQRAGARTATRESAADAEAALAREATATATEEVRAAEKAEQSFDPSFYINVAENARKRCEKLEREVLELRVEVERLRREDLREATSGASSLIWGDEK